jgi:hypothetical protein
MIDPSLALALAVHTTKGTYALLLGSGISRSASIPTGWEVVLDLIRKLAHLQQADCAPDPADWYVRTYNEQPDYARLLDQLAHTPTARQQLLKAYFEPNDDERAQGLKRPTAAHRSIAELVAAGAIRVIITTNFDRLLEQALDTVGVTPTVISTTDAVAGALPLHLTPCTIIKLHGDYLDVRIKNTPDELATYDDRVNTLLDRVFDEHGLIVCGWSGDWDVALRAAIERCPNRRFTTFWMAKNGMVSDRAQQLITLRHAQIMVIESADAAFQSLAEKITALDTFSRPHPLSTAMAVATLKSYIVDERHRIRLHDLMMEEIGRLRAELHNPQFTASFQTTTNEVFAQELQRRTRQYEALSETAQAMIVMGCYWGTVDHNGLWVRCIEQIATLPPRSGTYYEAWLRLQRYPALLLLYAGGVAALAAERYDTLAALLTQPITEELDVYERRPAVLTLYPGAVLKQDLGRLLPSLEQHHTPTSDRLFEVVRPPLRELIPDDRRFIDLFDRFEYLLALVHADVRQQVDSYSSVWGPVGQFGWRYRHQISKGPAGMLATEIEAAGQAWAPLQAGLFGGSLEQAQKIKVAFDERLSRFGWD